MVRVNELLKRSLSELIRKEITFQEGLITVTSVDVSPDLHNARVYIGVIANHPEAGESALKKLTASRVKLQSLMSKEVVLKFTPRLEFILDTSSVRGVRVLQLLDELEEQNIIPKEIPQDTDENESYP